MKQIIIIGEKNVGKSSLFNLLINKKQAVTINYHGYTRDCNSGYLKINKIVYKIIDTPGLGYKSDNIDILSLKKIWLIIKKSDLILFIINNNNNNNNNIEFNNIINMIKNIKKKIIYILNKIDLLNISNLNKNITHIKLIKISIKQKIGLHDLIKEINYNFNTLITKQFNRTKNFKILIIGRQNVGKSSLINALTKKNTSIIYNEHGTTRDNIIEVIKKNNQHFSIIDTPGIKKRKNIINKLEQLPINNAIRSMKNSNVSLIVIDIINLLNKQDLNIILNKNNEMYKIIIINKSDLQNKKSIIIAEKIIKQKQYMLKNTSYQFVSSKYKFGIKNIFKKINQIKNNEKNIDFKQKIIIFKNDINKINNKINITKITIVSYIPCFLNIYAGKNLNINIKKYICSQFIRNLRLKNLSIKFNFK